MGTVVEAKDFSNPIIRRKALLARNGATLATTVDFGELGSYTMDEPVAPLLRWTLATSTLRSTQPIQLMFTDEGSERLQEVVEETEVRCPVLNLVRDASVRVEMVWIAQAMPEHQTRPA